MLAFYQSEMNSRRALLLLSLLFCVASPSCRAPEVRQGAPPHDTDRATGIELVESEPVETSLDRADVADAADVWPQMIDSARRTLDLAEFYASEAEPRWRPRSKLSAVIDAILRAASRGVRVRFLADAKFGKQYPETLELLAASGVAVRRIDVEARTGGVLHAKYFVVDGAESFLGSQNFDWRALAHIQETGVRVRSTAIAGALSDIFETDWALAGGAPPEARTRAHAAASRVAVGTGEALSLVASPKGWLPDEASWDLPRLVEMLDGARRTIALQVLTYKTKDRSGAPFTTLDDALRRARARGVAVRVLVSDWSTKGDARRALDDLQAIAGCDVRVLSIPKWSGGDIPFARVAHAKYLVVDGAAAWIGTSNWEGDYFTRSRNVGVVAEGGALPTRVARFFDENWSSAYAAPLASSANADAPPPTPALTPPADAGRP